MSRYEKYKSTNIEWIGEIPEHWEEKKFKHLYKSNMGSTLLKIDLVEGGKLPVYSATESDVLFGYVDEANVILEPGDLVIPARGNSIGHVKMIHETATCTQTTIYAKKIVSDFDNRFLFQYLTGLRKILFQFEQTAIPQITVGQVKENIVLLPPRLEQTAIANFLDVKTAQIDKLIANKKQLIELLKEERTAIINNAVNGEGKNWIKKKLKYVVSKVGSGITPKGGANVYLPNGIALLRSQNIYNDGLRLDDVAFISEEIDAEMSNTRVQEGDVLLNITGASIGRCNYIPQEFGLGNVNQHVCIIRPIKTKISTKFLHTFLISGLGQNLIDSYQNGANREGLNFQQIKSFEVPLPGIQEQKAIVNKIEIQDKRIKQVVTKIEQEIQLMQEYKIALISEVVTGKQKVI